MTDTSLLSIHLPKSHCSSGFKISTASTGTKRRKGHEVQICFTDAAARAKGTALKQTNLSRMLALYSRISSLNNQGTIADLIICCTYNASFFDTYYSDIIS